MKNKVDDYPSYWKLYDIRADLESKFGCHPNLNFTRNIKWDWVLSPRPSKLLDFGGGRGSSGGFLNAHCDAYYRLDPDVTCEPDFKTFEDLPQDMMFDCVVSCDVFEHIDRHEYYEIFCNIFNVMKDGGKCIITIPNVSHWQKYIGDFDHKSPAAFHEIGMWMTAAGFDVVDAYLFNLKEKYNERLARINQDEIGRKVLSVLHECFEMHPASHVAICGIKNNTVE